MQLWSISLNKLISICSLHEKIFEPLSHRQIAHCIHVVYKSTFTSLTKILAALGIGRLSFPWRLYLYSVHGLKSARRWTWHKLFLCILKLLRYEPFHGKTYNLDWHHNLLKRRHIFAGKILTSAACWWCMCTSSACNLLISGWILSMLVSKERKYVTLKKY